MKHVTVKVILVTVSFMLLIYLNSFEFNSAPIYLILCICCIPNIYNYIFKLEMHAGAGAMKYEDGTNIKVLRLVYFVFCVILITLAFIL